MLSKKSVDVALLKKESRIDRSTNKTQISLEPNPHVGATTTLASLLYHPSRGDKERRGRLHVHCVRSGLLCGSDLLRLGEEPREASDEHTLSLLNCSVRGGFFLGRRARRLSSPSSAALLGVAFRGQASEEHTLSLIRRFTWGGFFQGRRVTSASSPSSAPLLGVASSGEGERGARPLSPPVVCLVWVALAGEAWLVLRREESEESEMKRRRLQ